MVDEEKKKNEKCVFFLSEFFFLFFFFSLTLSTFFMSASPAADQALASLEALERALARLLPPLEAFQASSPSSGAGIGAIGGALTSRQADAGKLIFFF